MLCFNVCVFAGENDFHPPQTEAERALDGILIIESGLDVYDYTTHAGGKKSGNANKLQADYWLTEIEMLEYHKNKSYNTKKTLVFPKIFTANTLQQYNSQDSSNSNIYSTPCYDNSETISCAPNYAGMDFGLEYKTVKHNHNDAIIQSHTKYLPYQPVYTMVKQNGKWKLDGADCQCHGVPIIYPTNHHNDK